MSRFLFGEDRDLSGGPVQNYNQLFLTEKSSSPRHTLPDPWQLLISVCPSGLCSSRLLRPRGPLQINYKRLGNHSNSIWPWASGLLFDPRVRLSVGKRISEHKPDRFSVLIYSDKKKKKDKNSHLIFSPCSLLRQIL